MAAVPFVTDWRVKLVPQKTLVTAVFLLGSGAIRISEDGPECGGKTPQSARVENQEGSTRDEQGNSRRSSGVACVHYHLRSN